MTDRASKKVLLHHTRYASGRWSGQRFTGSGEDLLQQWRAAYPQLRRWAEEIERDARENPYDRRIYP